MKDTQKGRKSPSKGQMFKTAVDPFEKVHVFQTAVKLRSKSRCEFG